MTDLSTVLKEVREALEPFGRLCQRIERAYPGYKDGVSLFFDMTHGDLRRARSALASLDALAEPVATRECATEGCGASAGVYFERGGVGSYYCGSCYLRVQAIPHNPALTTGGGDE